MRKLTIDLGDERLYRALRIQSAMRSRPMRKIVVEALRMWMAAQGVQITEDQGDVVLVPFPFRGARVEHLRPALVISTREYHAGCADCIVAMVTSRIEAPRRPGDHSVQGWKAAGLLHPSVVRAKLTTISRQVIRRRIGRLPVEVLDEFARGLAAVIGVARRDEA